MDGQNSKERDESQMLPEEGGCSLRSYSLLYQVGAL